MHFAVYMQKLTVLFRNVEFETHCGVRRFFFLESDRFLYIYSQTNCICSSSMLISLLPILFTCAHLKTDCAVLHVLIWKLTILFALPVY